MGKARAAASLLAAFLFSPVPASAVFTRAEMDVLESEPLFDSEYFLDLQAFSLPLEWEWDWADVVRSTGPVAAYRGNGASLDCCSLLLQQRALLRRPLAPWLRFAYDLRQEADKDVEDFHQWISMEAGPWHGWTIGAFGEPTFAKADADIGALVRYSPLPGLSLHAARDAVDWNFNSRGTGSRFYSRKPYTYETGAVYEAGADRWRAVAELDLPLERVDPSQNERYSYRRTTLTAGWERPVRDGRPGGSVRYDYEFKREGRILAPDPSALSIDFGRRVYSLAAAAVLPRGAGRTLELGLRGLRRSAASSLANNPSADSRFLRWELHPHARFRRQLRPWAVGESALFLSWGELRRARPNAPGTGVYSAPVEAKLGLGVDFLFGPAGRISLYSHFDIDDADRHVWDGGNVRAQIFF